MKALRRILFLSLYTSSKLSSDKNSRMRKRLTAVFISRAFRNSFPASNALKSNMAANAEFQDLAASLFRSGIHVCLIWNLSVHKLIKKIVHICSLMPRMHTMPYSIWRSKTPNVLSHSIFSDFYVMI